MNDARNNLEKTDAIKFEPHEIQSGLDRVRYAELLIEQLPADHDGRNTWLLNYGRENGKKSHIKLLDYTDLQEAANNLADERNDLRNQLDEANDLVSDLRTELDVQINSNLLTIHENARASWVAADKANAWETRYLHQCDITARALKSRQEWIDYGMGMKSFVIPNLSIMATLIFLWLAFGLGFVEPIVNGRAWFAGLMDWITWF